LGNALRSVQSGTTKPVRSPAARKPGLGRVRRWKPRASHLDRVFLDQARDLTNRRPQASCPAIAVRRTASLTPPRAASQETWPEVEKPRPRNLGQSRGGAPRGERARSGRSVQTDFPWRAPRPKRERVATAVGVARSIFSLRLPALRLPSFYLEAKHQWLSFLLQNSGADASRERDCFPPPRRCLVPED
jgi:hypothetical protein